MEPVIVTQFVFGVKTIQHQNGRIEYTSQSANSGTAKEVVIQRMKMFLIQLEREYAGEFDKSHGRFEK